MPSCPRQRYGAAVGAPFRSLVNPYRIIAPRSSPLFMPGGAQAGYLQAAIDQAWQRYTAGQFTLTRLGVTFAGRVTGGRLRFTRNGAGPFYLSEPTTTDVLQCSGALANGTMSSVELELGAEFCAAFNRGVASDPSTWYTPSAYYPAGAAKNDYAGFFHTIGIDHRAYGFAYDDINDQSSVKILPNSDPPTKLTLSIGW